MRALDTRFGPFDGRVWLNAAHQGPLPTPAHDEAIAAIAEKVSPSRITDESLAETPKRLRSALARLIGANADDVLLANSTSYTLNLIAQGLSWQDGDEVICVDGDLPATVVPWLPLERRGVTVTLLGDGSGRVDAEAVANAIGPRTRVVCNSWVFSFFGHAVDIDAVGRVCRERGVWFVVNGSQAVGARPLDVNAPALDALACCGFKWLCGPYATGFGWLRPELREQLDYPQPHWLRAQTAAGLNRALDYSLPPESTAQAFDVFCNANFVNFRALSAAVELLVELGIDRIAEHDQRLVDLALDGIDEVGYRVLSPRAGAERSTLVYVSHPDPGENERVQRGLRDAGIDIALREARLRVSPHLYNSGSDVERLVDTLARLR